MFLHNFKYNFLAAIRDKNQIFWSLIFTILLGTLFQSTFGNAYEKSDIVSNIQVCAYIEDAEIADNFSSIIESISLDEEHGEKLLAVTYGDSLEDAKKLLDEDDMVGMFYSEDGELKLMVKDTGITESILSSVVSQYHQIMAVIKDTANADPKVQGKVMLELMSDADINIEKSIGGGTMDVFIQYFYNLIAMSCLFACFTGVTFSIRNQANLSPLGARKTIAGSGGAIQTFAGLTAHWVILSVLTILALAYLMLIGVDFGSRIGGVILVILVGCMLGLSFGYFIGSIGKLSENAKDAIVTAVSLLMCFLSGLMILDMRMVVEEHCPIINRINPAVMISDAFYALNVYDTYERFVGNLISMTVLSAAFIVGGILLGRRKQYASL